MNPRQRKALELAQKRGQVSTRELQTRFPDACMESCRLDLYGLKDLGLLLALGSGRWRRYVLPDSIEGLRARAVLAVLAMDEAECRATLERLVDLVTAGNAHA